MIRRLAARTVWRRVTSTSVNAARPAHVRFATGSSTSGQTRSTGCSSGEAGGQEDQIDPLGHHEPFRPVPARPVAHEDDPMRRVDPVVLGERGAHLMHGLGVHARHEGPPALAGGRADDGGDIPPLIAPPDSGGRPLAPPRPDPPVHGEQPPPVLVLGPDGEAGRGMGRPDGIDLRRAPPLVQAAWATGSAVVVRGRGCCDVNPSARIAAQPRGAAMGRPR